MSIKAPYFWIEFTAERYQTTPHTEGARNDRSVKMLCCPLLATQSY